MGFPRVRTFLESDVTFWAWFWFWRSAIALACIGHTLWLVICLIYGFRAVLSESQPDLGFGPE
jgi:hypothetical protein